MIPQRLPLPYPGRDGRHRYFERIRHAPWPVMLDSGGGTGEKARYDILSAWPSTTLTTQGTTTTIRQEDGFRSSDEDPFALLNQALGEYARPFPDLPFAGGAIGVFAYDLGRRVERLPALADADIHLPDMAVGIYDWAVLIDHVEQTATLVKAGRAAQPSWENLVSLFTGPDPEPAPGAFRLTSDWTSNMDRAAYGRAFRRIQDYIRAGDCYQVNLAQRFSARFEGDPYAAWRLLTEHNRGPFSAFMSLPQGAVLSISPERFLRVSHGIVTTEPIKGTRPRHPNPSEDARLAEELRTSPKDRAENVMIVDLLRNDLGKSCTLGSVSVPELFGVYSFPAVHHLISTVTGTLAPGKTAVDLLRGAFPGGSITGAPKVRAMEIIEELEPHRRSVYCGTMGYIGYNGDMDTNITIRTLVAEGDKIHAWAGGGLVADSDEAAEYQETYDKVGKILPVLTATM